MSFKKSTAITTIAEVGTSTRSAWYAELKKRPPMLSNADVRAVLGIGQTKAWSLMQQLGAIKVGNRLKLDRNALALYLLSNRTDGKE